MTGTITKVGWNFDNTYARLPEFFFTHQDPTPVREPKAVLINHRLAHFLGLDPDALASEHGLAVLGGNAPPAGGTPLAQAYAGHQFGHFTMLGDGRALLIGEQITPTKEHYDLQLKGSGPTPYSRGGDGRATLGPMLREYIISEAMQALGIPTSRSLAVVTTGEPVCREMTLPGAILTRVASSHLRIGTFQYVAAWGTKEDLQVLADYAIERHYPHIAGSNKYQLFLRQVIEAQASLIAKWMLVGFIHGVMNTDNMTISGETIDYGPCAFMDTFDPTTVFSSIDRNGRYAYGNQSRIALWNLTRFAETLVPLLGTDVEKSSKLAHAELDRFADLYNGHWLAGLKAKLGLLGNESNDEDLIKHLLQLMYQNQADYTNTFLDLTFDQTSQEDLHNSPKFPSWQKRWKERLSRQPGGVDSAKELMRSKNPAVIPRNHRVEEALRAAVKDNDYCPLKTLLKVLEKPFDHSPEQKEFAQPPSPSVTPYCTFCGT